MDNAAVPRTARSPHRRKRRQPERGWKSVPKWVIVLVPLCLLLVLLFPLGRKYHWFRRPPAPAQEAVLPPPALLLDELSLDRQTGRLSGVISNSSGRPYENVQVSFSLRDRRGIDAGVLVATIPRLEAHSSGRFTSDPLPKEAPDYDLREITGTPR